MDHGIDIIPISAYRRAPPAGVRAQPARVETRKGGGFGLAIAAAAGLLFVASVALSRAQTVGSIAGLPPTERTAIYQRALDDAEAACAIPTARTGALADHCRSQAEFLILFPECDARCQRIAAAILPHARR
jgi:hypothetical protein